MTSAVRTARTSLGNALKGEGTLTQADVAERLQLTFEAMREALTRLPADTFDTQVVVNRLGRMEDKLFAWVRDETRFVPYVGTMRGARGVLMDRLGNSLDRSLLLAKMLELAGIDARLARTTLTGSQAESRLRALKSDPSPHATEQPDPTAGTADALLQAYSRRFGADPDVLRQRLKALRTSEEAMGSEAARRAHSQADTLLEAVGALSAGPGSDEAAYRQAIADHWWVQARQPQGWSDLDPGGIIGSAVPRPEAITTFRPDEIPRDLRHMLRVQVLVECACEGKIVERSVLDHTVDLTEHLFDPIELHQAPTKGPTVTEFRMDAKTWPQVREWLLEQKEWMPALSVGGTVVAQSAFTTDGEVRAPGSTSGPAGGLLDAFGGGGDDKPGVMTGEVIRYELLGPGVRRQAERRIIVDWIGPKARAAFATKPPADGDVRQAPLDLLHSVEVLPLVAQPSPEFVAHVTATTFIGASTDLLGLLRDQAPSLDHIDRPPALSLRLLELALARNRWNPERELTYLREANVLTRHQGVRDRSDGAEAWSAFDIVYNRVGVRPSVDAKSARRVRSRQGTLDTNAEVILDARFAASTNVSELMARDPGRKWIVQRDRERTPPSMLRVEQTPAGEDALGYWLFDPADGSVLGYTPSGWGGVSVDLGGEQGLTEFAVKHEKTIRLIGVIFRYLVAMACAAGAVREMLSADKNASSWFVMGRGGVKMTGCALGGVFGSLGIAYGGAVGNLYSRMGDIFTVAFTISSWI